MPHPRGIGLSVVVSLGMVLVKLNNSIRKLLGITENFHLVWGNFYNLANINDDIDFCQAQP